MSTDGVRHLIERTRTEQTLPGAVWVTIRDGRATVDSVGHEPDSVFRIASLTKPLVAMLTLCLADRGVLALDDRIDRWLPELSGRRVLRALGSDLDDTVPVRRALTVHDLLTMGMGFGWHPAFDGSQPLQRAITDHGLGPSAFAPAMDPATWLEQVGALPMIHQPGEGWLYDSSHTALGILLERTGGADLDALLAEHVTGPLGMGETTYTLDERTLPRLPALLTGDPPTIERPAGDPEANITPAIRGGATGLFSTAADLTRLALAFLGEDTGLPGGVIDAMRQDHRAPGQRAMSELFLEPGTGWGYGVSVDVRPRYGSTDRFGWSGGTGTTLFADPRRRTAGILLTQVGFDAEFMSPLLKRFWQLTA
ncbi:beta-lactamase family protein [Aeromicrobium sp. YIM 150415]|uniref:serine hydrolase domain-containing protein n=1 Tax=Aeromicrobium sp. YIM 150415 TaxID=2803912 RepID=UPI0019643D14|nr:serine hydrolase domain-containing protein [Aeromicrobium sp. YIM 150415]MBM9465240.1 beta-lactamase family protein [Aeromicrobium sp. YIM 150415]